MKSKPHRPSRNAAAVAQMPFISSWQWAARYPALIWQSTSSHRLVLPVMPLPGWNLHSSFSEQVYLLLWNTVPLRRFVHKCLWHSVPCSQCLLVCLLQPRAWQRVCVMSLWAIHVHCIHQMLHTQFSTYKSNPKKKTETFLNWKTLERKDSFTL